MSEELKIHCGEGCYPSHIFSDEAYYQNFICPICQGVSLNAVIDEDGHAFGEKCITNYSKIKAQCPKSKKDYSKDFKFIISYDIRNHISQAKVRCPNNNCKWSSKVEDLEKHLKECSEQIVRCTNKECKSQVKRKQMVSHLKKECEFNLISCSFAKKCKCDKKVVDKEMLKHLLENHAEELREAADNYYNEPENMVFYPLTARNSDRSTLNSFATPGKFRKDLSMHDLKPINESSENYKGFAEKYEIPPRLTMKKK